MQDSANKQNTCVRSRKALWYQTQIHGQAYRKRPAIFGVSTQLCQGINCGIEHTFYPLRLHNEKSEQDSVLLLDAKSAFNCFFRCNFSFANIKRICPILKNFVAQNSYSALSDLYVPNQTLRFLEDTTQGKPFSMALNGVATLPLLRLVQSTHLSQQWHANNGSEVRLLEDLVFFFKQLSETILSTFAWLLFWLHRERPEFSISSERGFKGKNFRVVWGDGN